MNSKERFYSTIKYAGYDRPPTKHYGTPEINKALQEYFGVSTYEELQLAVGDDFRHVEPCYIGPELRKFEDGSWEGLWGERYTNFSFGGGTYPEAVFLPFKGVDNVSDLKKFRFPSPDWYDYSTIKSQCEKYKGYAVNAGGPDLPDFMNSIARCRGVEQVLLDIATMDPVYLALVDQRHDFFLEKCKRTLEAGEGLIDVLCVGEDYGNQNGLMISPKTFDALFAPRMKSFFELAHRYGAKTMMHCCGSCYALIPRLIDLGLDILEVVQVDAVNMGVRMLHEKFYGKIAFCGSISVQNTLPFGSEADVVNEVELRKKLFQKGGMIIAATHDIQVGTPIRNVVAMYRAIGSLKG
jgi:uroporphyrinogen decarboxylase